MVSVLTSMAVDCGFESRPSQTNDYEICVCRFLAKRAALRRKSKDWLAWNQDNVSECVDMSICGLWIVSVSQHYKIQLGMLV